MAHQQGEQVLVSACREALKTGLSLVFYRKKHFTKPLKCTIFVSAMRCTFTSVLNHLHQVPYFLSHITEDVCIVKIGVC